MTVRHWAIHFGRIGLLISILLVMHAQHNRVVISRRAQSLSHLEFERIKPLFPNSEKWGESERHGGRQILSIDGKVLGYVIQTAPESDRFLGFSGPTNLLVALSASDQIVGIQLLESRDTRNHVELILKHTEFFRSWIGLSWSEAAARAKIDGVSGATLTSLAMVQGIQSRLGAAEVSRKFPNPLIHADVVPFFPQAVRVEPNKKILSLWNVYDKESRMCGAILRTSPAADEVIGYQGPTETRLAISNDGSIVGIAIGNSFDNEPYVGYVKGDAYFAKIVKKYSLTQWSRIDLAEAGIEGVSGATMTSLAVANGIVEAAKRYQLDLQSQTKSEASYASVWWRSLSTIVIIIIGLVVGLTSLRGRPAIRVAFQVVVIVYLGLINGDLLSIAMIQGWAQSGIPWKNGLSLIALATAAVVLPIAARTNIYCSHLCPHGALQQILPRRWKWKTPMPPWIARTLRWIRPLLLAWIAFVCLLQLPFSLVDIEPFDAYSWRAAAWPTMLVAVLGIAASIRVPMAYCRFGCGTGAILQYLRRNSQSHRLNQADLFAFICFVFGGLLYLFAIPG